MLLKFQIFEPRAQLWRLTAEKDLVTQYGTSLADQVSFMFIYFLLIVYLLTIEHMGKFLGT